MRIELICLLWGTAAELVLFPTQKRYEKCSPFPYLCTSMQGSHFFFMYLFSYVLHRQQPGNASVNMNNKNNEELHNEGLSGVFWYVERSCGWELCTIFVCKTSHFDILTGCPVDGGVISTTLLCAPREADRLH